MKRWLDYFFGIPLVWFFSFFKKRTKSGSSPSDAKKILIIKLAAVGDTILLIPVLRKLREARPEAQIHWLVSGVNSDIASTVPYVDRLIIWHHTSLSSFFDMIRILRAESYDLIIDLEQWDRATALVSFLADVRSIIGFDTPKQFRASLFTNKIPKSSDQHEILEFYKAFDPMIQLARDTNLELWETENGRAELGKVCGEALKNKVGLRVLLHPGCGEDGFPREWPLVNYALLGNWLLRKMNAQIFISGGPEEIKKTSQLTRLLDGQSIDLGGKLSWQGMISLVSQMDLLISGNTGVMHIAAALKKSQIALHGPTNSKLWGPLNPKALVLTSSCPNCPCLILGYEYHVHDQSCMSRIEFGEVKNAASRIIDNNGHIL